MIYLNEIINSTYLALLNFIYASLTDSLKTSYIRGVNYNHRYSCRTGA